MKIPHPRTALLLLVTLHLMAACLTGQNRDHSYRSFSQPITPNQLNELLGSSNAVQKKIVSDKIAETVLKKFGTLTPKQQERLIELSKDFQKGRNPFEIERQREILENAISSDPEMKKAAEELRKAFSDQKFGNNTTDRRAIEKGIREEVRRRLQRQLEQYQSNGTGGNSDGFPNGFPQGTPSQGDPDIFRQNSGGKSTVSPNRPNLNGDPDRNRDPTGSFDPTRPGQRRPTGMDPGTNRNTQPDTGTPRSFQPGNIPRSGFPETGKSNEPDNNLNSNPFGGFSDDGNGFNNGQPDRPAGIASASGQTKELPKENIGHRFNKIVMNSIEKAMEKKVGGDAGEEKSFNRLLNKFVDSISKSNPEMSSTFSAQGSGIFNRLEQGVRQGSNRIRMSRFNLNGFGGRTPSLGGGGFNMPAVSPQSLMTMLLIAVGIGVAIYFLVRATPLAQMLGMQPPATERGVAPELTDEIKDYNEVVELIDRFTLWLFGKKADWWHSKKVQQEVAIRNPELAAEIREMMKVYDCARYSNTNEPVSAKTVAHIKMTLGRIKEIAEIGNSQKQTMPTPSPTA